MRQARRQALRGDKQARVVVLTLRHLLDVWRGRHPFEALSGVRNLFLTLLSMLSMCDPADLGGVLDSSNLGRY